MKLLELNPIFLKLEGEHTVVPVSPNDLLSADGIMVECPACKQGGIRSHYVQVWESHTGKGIWRMMGSSFNDLTIEPEIRGADIHACNFTMKVEEGNYVLHD